MGYNHITMLMSKSMVSVVMVTMNSYTVASQRASMTWFMDAVQQAAGQHGENGHGSRRFVDSP